MFEMGGKCSAREDNEKVMQQIWLESIT